VAQPNSPICDFAVRAAFQVTSAGDATDTSELLASSESYCQWLPSTHQGTEAGSGSACLADASGTGIGIDIDIDRSPCGPASASLTPSAAITAQWQARDISAADCERQWRSQGMRSLGSSPTALNSEPPQAVPRAVAAPGSGRRPGSGESDADVYAPCGFRFSALHCTFRRLCEVTEAVQPPRRRRQREIAEEVMSWVGMTCGVCTAGFPMSTDSAALSSPESLAWFASRESRFKDGDWPRRPRCVTAESMGQLIVDLVQRWVDIPVVVDRSHPRGSASASLSIPGPRAMHAGDDSDRDGAPSGSGSATDDASAADGSHALASESCSATSARHGHLPPQVIFIFGTIAWLLRIADVGRLHA